MNLKGLLNKYDKIEIPMLQRDYAQGRKSQISVANEFLDAIFAVLDDSKQEKTLHIDFIYGYKENNKFLLIDGQQRVTTLWLLHFYIYKKAGLLDSIVKELGKFSYSVRKSSKKFCQNLLSEDFDLSIKPSEAIAKNVGAFESLENLNNDPTIKAMLNMLDLIYERIKNKRDFEKLAKNLDNITFDEFDMDMGDFRLGEELYIKMNARGKQLSRYENLKSFIEKGKVGKDKGLLASIDNDWSDYFFDSNSVDSFDKKGLNFLHYANLFFKFENNENINIREVIQNPNRPIDDFYTPLQNIENIKLLNKVIEMYNAYKSDLPNLLKMSESAFFSDTIMGYVDISYFFATLFFIKNSTDTNLKSLKDYLRVCRNLIENHQLDDPEHTKHFFYTFKEISRGCDDIYQFLCDNPNVLDEKYDFEKRKARLILSYKNNETTDNWEEIFDKTSDNRVLAGRVDFLLDFSDDFFEYESYDENVRFYEKSKIRFLGGFKSKYNNPNFEKFNQYANLTMQIFDKNFLDNNLGLFQRAFLSIGDYGFYETNYFYGNIPTAIYRDREAINWLLSGMKNTAKEPYFKTFLDLLLKSKADNLDSKMREIIAQCDFSQKNWWEQLLIKQEGLFEFLNAKKEIFQRTRRIRFWDNPRKVELLPAIRSTKNVRDLLDYGFYLYCNDKKIQNLSEYTSDEEQYGNQYPLESHFKINGKEVLCNSMNAKITFGKQEFSIDMDGDIFAEFDKVLDSIKS